MIKSLLPLLILLPLGAFAQSVTINAGAGEPSVVATFSGPAITQIGLQIQNSPATTAWPNSLSAVPQSTTLTASMTAAQTTVSLASSTSIAVCNGLLIDSEVMLVTSISPLTILRGTVGTTAATHANSAPVTVLRTGGYNCQLKAMWFDQTYNIITTRLNSSALSQSQAALTAQQTANAVIGAAGVQ